MFRIRGSRRSGCSPRRPGNPSGAFAVDDLAQRVVLAGGGELYVADIPDEDTPAKYRRLLGTANVDAITFLGSPDRLVSASGRSLLLWDLNQRDFGAAVRTHVAREQT